MLFWPMNDQSGTTANDLSTSSTPGVLNTTVPGSLLVGTSPTNPLFTQSNFYFNSVGTPSVTGQSTIVTPSAFTVEVWISGTLRPNAPHFFTLPPSITFSAQFGNLQVVLNGTGQTAHAVTTTGISSTTLYNGSAHHLVATYGGAGTAASLYMDGVLVASSVFSITLPPVPAVAVVGTGFVGTLGWFAFYPTVHNASVIAARFALAASRYDVAGQLPTNVSTNVATSVTSIINSSPAFYNAIVPSPSSQGQLRFISSTALSYLVVGVDARPAQYILQQLFQFQITDPTSAYYGAFNTSNDPANNPSSNQIIFIATDLVMIHSAFGYAFPAAFVQQFAQVLDLMVYALLGQGIAVTYTNQFVSTFASIILIGEALGNQTTLDIGLQLFYQWTQYTQINGISEVSPDYYDVHLAAFETLYLCSSTPIVVNYTKQILDMYYCDILSDFFPGRQAFTGAHMRDYYWPVGYDLVDPFLWLLGLSVVVNGDYNAQVNNPTLYPYLYGAGYIPNITALPVASILAHGTWSVAKRTPPQFQANTAVRANYINPEIAMGSYGVYAGAEDKELNIAMASSNLSFPLTFWAAATVDNVWGIHHEEHPPFYIANSYFEKALLVTFYMYQADYAGIPVFSSSLVFPAFADVSTLNNTVTYWNSTTSKIAFDTGTILGLWEETSCMVMQMFYVDQPIVNFTIQTDSIGIGVGEARATVYHFVGNSTNPTFVPTGPRAVIKVAMVFLASTCQSTADWNNLYNALATTQLVATSNAATGMWNVSAAFPSGVSLGVLRSLYNEWQYTRYVNGTQIPTASGFMLNGVDMTKGSNAIPFYTIVPPTASYVDTIRQDNPLMLWLLHETSGTTAFDSSCNGNNGVYPATGVALGSSNSLLLSHPTKTSPTFSGGFVQSSAPFANSQIWTLEVWLQSSNASQNSTVVEFAGASGNITAMIYTTSDGYVQCLSYNPNLSAGNKLVNWITSILPVLDGNIHHVVCTYMPVGGPAIGIYIDGDPINGEINRVGTPVNLPSNTVMGSIRAGGDPFTPLYYGAVGGTQPSSDGTTLDGVAFFGTTGYFYGTLAAIAYYPYVLTQNRISAHYLAGVMNTTSNSSLSCPPSASLSSSSSSSSSSLLSSSSFTSSMSSTTSSSTSTSSPSSSTSAPSSATSSLSSSVLTSSSSSTGTSTTPSGTSSVPLSSSSSPSSSSSATSSSSSSSASTSSVLWNLPLVADYNDIAVVGTAVVGNTTDLAGCTPYFNATVLPSGVAGRAWYNPCNNTNDGLLLQYTTITTNYTMEVWCLTQPSLVGPHALIGTSPTLLFGVGCYRLVFNLFGNGATYIGSGFPNVYCVISSTPITGWNHYAFTYDDSTSNYTIYLNGASKCTYNATSAWDVQTPPHPRLAYQAAASSTPLSGFFINFVGWNYPRNASQILADYQSGLVVASSISSSTGAGS